MDQTYYPPSSSRLQGLKKRSVDNNVIRDNDSEKHDTRKKMKTTQKATDNLESAISKNIETDQLIPQLNYSQNNKGNVSSTTEMKPMMNNPRLIMKKKTVNGNIFYNKKHNNLLKNKRKRKIPLKIPTNGKFSKVKIEKISFKEIENLYNKYFSRSLNDTIIIISNILNIILLSNKYLKSQMDYLFRKTDVKKERADVKLQHMKYKNVLEVNLNNLFKDVLSSINYSEFKITVQMVFLNILKVFTILDQHRLNKMNLFKNLVYVLWKSLSDSAFENPKLYLILKCKSFYFECINLSCVIEDNRNKDLDINNRMSSYCEFILNSKEYFKRIIDTVTSDSNEDLTSLMDECINEFRAKKLLTFKYQKNYFKSTENCVIDKILVMNKQNSVKHCKRIKHCMKAQATNETYQPMPTINENTVKNTANINLEHSSTNLPSVSTCNGTSILKESTSIDVSNKRYKILKVSINPRKETNLTTTSKNAP